MILLSYPIYDKSVARAVVSFLSCSAETIQIDWWKWFCLLALIASVIVASYVSPRPVWRERVVTCLALNSSRCFGSWKGSAGNPSCFLTKEEQLCVLARGTTCRAGGPGWGMKKLHGLCRRVTLGKGSLSNHVGAIQRCAVVKQCCSAEKQPFQEVLGGRKKWELNVLPELI